MWILVLALAAGACLALAAGYIRNRRLLKQLRRGEIDHLPQVVDADAECCGRHELCEKDSLLTAVSRRVDYYDDEELDAYRHLAPSDYTGEQVDRFRDVFYTLLETDVAGWVRSLQLRGIALPSEIRDEVLLIISERRADGTV